MKNRLAVDPNEDQIKESSNFEWLAAGLFIFSIITGFALIGGSFLSALFVFLGAVMEGTGGLENQLISSLLFSAGLGFAGLLMIPTVYYSGRRLFGYPSRSLQFLPFASWLGLTLPLIIYLGYLSQTGPSWGKYALPFLHVLANGVGVLWVLHLVVKKLPAKSALRYWGSFGSGLTLAPMIAFGVEILILIGLVLIWLIILQSQPELKEEILNLINRIQHSSLTPQIMERMINNLLQQPGVVGTGFIYVAVLIPLVEEIIKPIGIWLFLGKNPSPQTGFIMGAAAGAGYALFENLTIGADLEVWTFVTITRLGTAAVHILTTGLVSWGLASAWTEKKYLRFVSALFSAILLHGVWNGLNILNALVDMSDINRTLGGFGRYFATFAPAGLAILALGALGGLIWINSTFRRAIIPQVE